MRHAESRLSALEGRRQTSLDRLPDFGAGVTFPVEGQQAVDSDDERHMWYSNGAWRKASSQYTPVICLAQSFQALYTLSGALDPVAWYVVRTNDTDVFTVNVTPGSYSPYCDTIGLNKTGMYLFWAAGQSVDNPAVQWNLAMTVTGGESIEAVSPSTTLGSRARFRMANDGYTLFTTGGTPYDRSIMWSLFIGSTFDGGNQGTVQVSATGGATIDHVWLTAMYFPLPDPATAATLFDTPVYNP